MEQNADHGDAFERAWRQMEARRSGEERSFLRVTFLIGERVEKERILEERYACRAMENWTARGSDHRVRNQPYQLPRSGVAATLAPSDTTQINGWKGAA